ncbi:hypothetical protein AB4Z22_18535 [Paenibacillus sp. TAF58]
MKNNPDLRNYVDTELPSNSNEFLNMESEKEDYIIRQSDFTTERLDQLIAWILKLRNKKGQDQ